MLERLNGIGAVKPLDLLDLDAEDIAGLGLKKLELTRLGRGIALRAVQAGGAREATPRRRRRRARRNAGGTSCRWPRQQRTRRLIDFYMEHAPEKLPRADKLVERYHGQLPQMLVMLHRKYRPCRALGTAEPWPRRRKPRHAGPAARWEAEDRAEREAEAGELGTPPDVSRVGAEEGAGADADDADGADRRGRGVRGARTHLDLRRRGCGGVQRRRRARANGKPLGLAQTAQGGRGAGILGFGRLGQRARAEAGALMGRYANRGGGSGGGDEGAEAGAAGAEAGAEAEDRHATAAHRAHG